MNDVIICQDFGRDLADAIASCPHDKLFLLTDETTHRLCLPIVEATGAAADAQMITIGAGDVNKNIETLAAVWKALSDGGASRKSLLVCLGGGMVTDLGGFAASTFKRGIPYINIPTTLLAMVDAAVGGKTAINFNGLKNEVGVFQKAWRVLLDTEFLRSLDMHNLLSGYAEMLKHGLISNKETLDELLAFDMDDIDYQHLKQMVGKSVQIKEDIVQQDPREQGIRKALNLGHTIGHAFEAYALHRQTPVLHGYAVAWGLVCELYLSYLKTGFPKETMLQVNAFVRENYGAYAFTCDDYPSLYELMKHDKKNVGGIINFTLLGSVGDIRLNQTADRETIYQTFDFFRECMGM